jgi:hypothetical protein
MITYGSVLLVVSFLVFGAGNLSTSYLEMFFVALRETNKGHIWEDDKMKGLVIDKELVEAFDSNRWPILTQLWIKNSLPLRSIREFHVSDAEVEVILNEYFETEPRDPGIYWILALLSGASSSLGLWLATKRNLRTENERE